MIRIKKLGPQHILSLWANGLKNGNSKKVTNLYSRAAVLLATLDSKALIGRRKIKPYFDNLVKKSGLRCIFHEIFLIKKNVYAGFYTFKWDSGSISARFTFVIGHDGILHHHSSVLP